MRELTFAGFLAQYVKELSLGETRSIRRLTAEAATENPRLREPLLLYAVCHYQLALLEKWARRYELQDFYGDLLLSDEESILKSLRQRGVLPSNYDKVYQSFLTRKNRRQTDDETKMMIRERVLALQRKKNVSNYRVYRDLALNPGNVNAWLKHGNSEKVSLRTARDVLRYVSGC